MGKAYPVSPQAAVGAVVFSAGRVLLVRRRDPPSAGEWAIPGGSVGLGETLQAAAEREILEETGIAIAAGEPVYAFDAIHHDARGRVIYHYVVVDLLAEYLHGEPAPRDDAIDARWVTATALGELELNAVTRHLLVDRLGFGRA